MNKLVRMGTFAGALAVAGAPSAFADSNVTIVTPSSLDNWINTSASGGTVAYVDGAPAGLGANSLELKASSDATSQAVYARAENMSLSDINNASYWTKQAAASSSGSSAIMTFGVDLNGDGRWDTNLVFDPSMQNKLNADSSSTVSGQWQQWNVRDGMFWSSKSFGSGTAALEAGSNGMPSYTLSNILANYPHAQLKSLGVNVGSSSTVDVDGIALNGTIYNFENTAASVGNKTPANKDDCSKDLWKALQNVDGRMFNNLGQCISYAAQGKDRNNVETGDDTTNNNVTTEAHANEQQD